MYDAVNQVFDIGMNVIQKIRATQSEKLDEAGKEANAKEKAKQNAPTTAKKAESKKAEPVTEKAQTRNDKKSTAPKDQPTVTDAEVVEDSETEPEDSDMFA